MKRNSLILLLLVLALLVRSQPTTVYTFSTFLNAVRNENPLALKAGNSSEYGLSLYRAARGSFDPQLSSSFESKQFNSTNYFSFGTAELKQPLYTSQYLKAGYQYGQGVYLNPERSTSMKGLPYLGLEISLLQGLRIDKSRASLIKAKHYTDFYNAEQKIILNDLLLLASTTYAEALYLNRVNLLLNYFSSLADQRLKGIIELTSAGERPAIDTVEAAILLQGRMLDRLSSEIDYNRKLNDLTVLRPGNGQSARSNIALMDSLELVYALCALNLQFAISNFDEVNPVLSQYKAKQLVLETEKRLKREMIKPVLNLSYNFLNTSEDVFYPSLNTRNYKWGATFSFPLFLRQPRNEYKMANIDARNNELETENKQNQLGAKRKFIVESLQLISEQITNAEKSVSYNKLLVNAEQLKFTIGEGSLFLLNSRESKLLETELKLAEYRLKFIKAFLDLTYLNGELKYELNN